MSFGSVVAVARGADLGVLRARAERLAAFSGLELRLREGARGTALVVSLGGDGSLAWGTPLPAGPGAEVVCASDAARISTGAVDVQVLWGCDGRAWSTHAVAAAYLARGELALRPEALAELVAFGHVASTGSLVEGVVPVPAATEITLHAAGVRERTTLGREARWALVPERHAFGEASAALEAELLERAGRGPVQLGLSAGLDSRVVAAGLRRVGVPFEAFTWGRDGDPDVEGARAVARRLGVAHRIIASRPLGDEETLVRLGRDARWSEGTAPVGLLGGTSSGDQGGPSTGADASGIHLGASSGGAAAALAPSLALSGAGGELGRAFHYALLARTRRRPGVEQLREVWAPERQLPAGTPAEEVEHVRAVADRVVAEAAALPGIDGWRVLDVVYAESRMRYWLRSGLRAGDGPLAPVFLAPRLAVALVAQPLEARLADGFHRRFLEDRAPDLAALGLPEPPRQRRGVPAPVRRVAARARARRPAPRPDVAVPSGAFADRPATAAHLRAVLRDPLVLAALGDGPAERDDLALAMTVAPAVALRDALREAGLLTPR